MSDKKYVWETWMIMGRSKPVVTRYSLIKVGDKGTVTVNQRGSLKVLRPAQGKRFFTDYSEMIAFARVQMVHNLKTLRGEVAQLEVSLLKGDLGLAIEEMPEVQPKFGALKLKDDE